MKNLSQIVFHSIIPDHLILEVRLLARVHDQEEKKRGGVSIHLLMLIFPFCFPSKVDLYGMDIGIDVEAIHQGHLFCTIDSSSLGVKVVVSCSSMEVESNESFSQLPLSCYILSYNSSCLLKRCLGCLNICLICILLQCKELTKIWNPWDIAYGTQLILSASIFRIGQGISKNI